MLIQKRFKKIMTVINSLLTIPVIWVLVRELMRPGPVRIAKVLATAALVAIPLLGTAAVTIAGNACLSLDGEGPGGE